MSYTDDINALIDEKIAVATSPKRWLGTVTYDNGGYQQGLATEVTVVLDGSSSEVTALRPKHIRADVDSRVMVESVNGTLVVTAEMGGGRYLGAVSVQFLSELLDITDDYATEGAIASVTEDSSYYRYDKVNGNGWQRIGGPAQPMMFDDDSTDITIDDATGTSYVNGTNVCGFSFIAPVTGQGLALVGGFGSSPGSQILRVSTCVREGNTVGSGTTFLAASDVFVFQPPVGSGNMFSCGMPRLVTGLTPGAEYNIVTQHRVNSTTAGDGILNHRSVTWIPDN